MNYKGIKDKKHTCLNCKKDIPFKAYAGNWHKYCDSKCCGEHRAKKTDERDLLLFNEGKLKNRRQVYKFLVAKQGNNCSVCGIPEWNNKPLRLWVDHIDGNASNNMPYNFRLICPNCDSQSETFGAKNRGNGRRSRGMRPYG